MGDSQVITPNDPNKRIYNGGSELQDDYSESLPGYFQTFYRNYDPALGRFIAVDPVAEAAESWTTYQYAYNNPAMLNDPMGDRVNVKQEEMIRATKERTRAALQNGYVFPYSSGAAEWTIEMDEQNAQAAEKWFRDNHIGNYSGVYDSSDDNYWNACAIIDAGGGNISAGLANYNAVASKGQSVATYVYQNGKVGFLPSGTNGNKMVYQGKNNHWSFVDGVGDKQANQGGARDRDNWWSNFLMTRQLTQEWDAGTGPVRRVFNNDNVARAMSNAYGVNKARDFFYAEVNREGM